MYVYCGVLGNYKAFLGQDFKSPYWTTEDEMKTHRETVIINASMFMFVTIMLIISIVKTIMTNPGNIPVDKEWDIHTSDSAFENLSVSSH